MVRMKPLRAVVPILLVSALFIGCSSNAPINMNPIEAGSILRQYYAALNSYDIKRIEDIFTKKAWQEEEVSFRPRVYWAENIGFKSSLLSVKSIEIKQDSVKVTAEVTSKLGSWDDYFYLVREHSSWKIDRLITREFSNTQSVDNTAEQIPPGEGAAKPSCCE